MIKIANKVDLIQTTIKIQKNHIQQNVAKKYKKESVKKLI